MFIRVLHACKDVVRIAFFRRIRQIKIQKQPPEVSFKISVFKNFADFTEKHHRQNLLFSKVAGLSSATSLKKRLGHIVFACESCDIFKNLF